VVWGCGETPTSDGETTTGADIVYAALRRLSLKHLWLRLWASRGNRLSAALLVVGFALALVVFGGIVAVHRFADRRMAATRLVSVVAADLDRFQVMPWDAQQQLGPAGTRREMRVAEAQLRRDLRILRSDASSDMLTRRITAEVARDAQILELQRRLITNNKMPQALAANTRGDLVHVAVRADLTKASAKYADAASDARLLATVASGTLLLALFLAFAVALGRLVRSREQLRELDVMKDEFVALVSHELRTPLTAIQGYTELVLDGTAGELNDEQRTMLGAVDRNSVRLFRLINDLLFVAQVNAGKLHVAIEDVDLVAVAAEAVSDAQPRAVAAGVLLEFECDLTPTVRADRVRLAQVFDNLISNAIKFTPPGGRVRLTVSKVGGDAMIVIADSGMGMTPADQQRLFTRFFRTKAAARIQGTGLGLSITKAILDAHHGSISVESEVGQGTRFTFTVPTRETALAQ
jgi:signal transduction histidine kinase